VPIRAQFRLRLTSFSGPVTLFRRITTLIRYNLPVLRLRMMTLFSSIWRADLCRIRAIPSVPESCKNHPMKSRPYSRSGRGALVKPPAGRYLWGRIIFLFAFLTSENYAHRSCQTYSSPDSPTERRSLVGYVIAEGSIKLVGGPFHRLKGVNDITKI
jgi:hypothetical protein